VLASAKGRGAPRSPFAALGAHAIAALRRADPRNGAAEAYSWSYNYYKPLG